MLTHFFPKVFLIKQANSGMHVLTFTAGTVPDSYVISIKDTNVTYGKAKATNKLLATLGSSFLGILIS